MDSPSVDSPSADRPNLVLVTVDTLRADRLGSYDEAAGSTPSFDRLAEEGALFVNAASPMPVTRPAHFSLLTSLYPRNHGVMSNGFALPEGLITLTETLREGGYRTAAFTGVKLLAPGSGAERGFEILEAPEKGEDRLAAEVVARASQWLETLTGDEPFFLWVHLYDPHMPYAPPDGFAVDPPEELAEELPIFSRPHIWPIVERTGGDLPARALDFALEMYAGEIDYVDHWLGQLRQALEENVDFDRTGLLLTADHGECFGHGIYFEHGACLYDGAIRIPMLLRLPGVVPAGLRVEHQVEILDAAPTLLELAGLEIPDQFRGRSLLSEDVEPRPAFFQHPMYDTAADKRRRDRRDRMKTVAGQTLEQPSTEKKVGVRTARWKLIVSPEGEELYDLTKDPREETNLITEQPEVAAELRSQLRRWLAANPQEVADRNQSSEMEKTLRSLGY